MRQQPASGAGSRAPLPWNCERYRYSDTLSHAIEWDTSRFAAGITRSVTWDVLRIDHFIIKSHAEFASKRASGIVQVS